MNISVNEHLMRMKKMLNNEGKLKTPMNITQHHDSPVDAERLVKDWVWVCESLTDDGYMGSFQQAVVNKQGKVWRLYEQARHLPSGKRARRMLDYFRRGKIWTVALCLTISAGHAATSPNGSVSPGNTVRASASTTWSTATTGEYYLFAGGGGAFSVAKATESPVGTCGVTPTDYTSSTSDGYVGILIAPDVVLGLTGTARGSFTDRNNAATGVTGVTRTYVGTWTNQGQFSVTPGNGTYHVWCGGTVNNRIIVASNLTPVVYDGTWFVHAGPNAALGTYTTPGISLSRVSADSIPATPIVLPGVIKVGLPTDCTVSLQNPTVDFGAVQQNSGVDVLLGFFQTRLNINCSLVDGGPGMDTAAMTISFTGTTGRWTDALALQGTEGQGSLAEVRGVRATGNGSCDNTADRMQFQGQQYSIGNVGAGLTSIPLTWSLCSNGNGGTGAGTAQATVTLTWP